MTTTILLISLLLSGTSLFLIWIIFKVIKQNLHYKVIRKHDTPYSFEVKNTDHNATKKAVLYGTNEYLLTPNFGSDIPIILNPLASNISYIECLQQSLYQPFETRNLKFVGKINELKDISINVTSKFADGQQIQFPIFLDQYIHPNDKNIDFDDTEKEQQVDVDYEIKIDGNTKFSFELKPNSSVKLYVFFNTTQYRAMTLFGYIKDLIKGNLPKEQKLTVNKPTIMPPSIKAD